MIRWLRSFNRHLWAALASHDLQVARSTRHRRPVWLFPVKRIAHALRWVDVALDGIGKVATTGILRSIKMRLQPNVWTLQTDACPVGMGAVLYKFGKPVEYFFAAEFTDFDHVVLGATRGCSASQTTWELYCLLVAVDLWGHWFGKVGVCKLQADSKATLDIAYSMSGRTPVTNALAAELGIRVETCGFQFELEHLRGHLNEAADALSRLAEGAIVPGFLS
eukprot:6486198-Amphidinium_carterae.1